MCVVLVVGALWACGQQGQDSTESLNEATIALYFRSRFQLGLENVFWGDLHGHSLYSYDAAFGFCGLAKGPAEALEYARDPLGGALDFVSLTDHAEAPPHGLCPPEDSDLWQSLLRIGREAENEDPEKGRVFLVFPGWEYTNTRGLAPFLGSFQGYGHKCVLFRDPAKVPQTRAASWMRGPGSRVLARDAWDLWAYLKEFRPVHTGDEGTALTIPHTASMKGVAFLQDHRSDWAAVDGDFVRHVELCSKWGSGEGPAPAAASCALGDVDELLDYDPQENDEPVTLRSLLYDRWVLEGNPDFCLGFVGGTDNHVGEPGNAVEMQCGTEAVLEHRGCVTGVAALALTRAGIWSALWNRHTLAATSGPVRLPLLVAAETGRGDALMGGQAAHDGSVRLRAWAHPAAQHLEVILDGCLYETAVGNVLDRLIPVGPGRHYLYVRAWREDSQGVRSQSWSSPVYLEQDG